MPHQIPRPSFNLSLEEAIPVLEQSLETMRADPNQQELTGVDPDTAFLLGFETAIHELKRITGPDTLEVGIVALVEGVDGKWHGSVIEGESNAE